MQESDQQIAGPPIAGPSIVPLPSGTKGKKQGPTSLSPFQLQLIHNLEIDTSLTKSHNIPNLQVAYAKYLAYSTAVAKLQDLKDTDQWQGPEPTGAELQKIFFSPQMWHSNYKQYFTDVDQWPEMKQWLLNGKQQDGRALFGGAAKVQPYSWADLEAYMVANPVEGKKFKGKEKVVEVVEDEGKEKRRHKKKRDKKSKGDEDV